ncbi:MAG: tRNA-uridine aminocarboxypropyltransferase [Pseudomonadales bacterium]
MPRPLCPQCARPLSVCFCHTVQLIQNQWPVLILQHPGEARRAIGTAKIAQLSLTDCQTEIGEIPASDGVLLERIEQQQPYLVYPDENSLSLEDISNEPIRPLLFLDGTWRKTKRMLFESPILAQLPKVGFSPQHISRYRIRKEPTDEAISTIEAIAFVLQTLEQAPDKYQGLLTTMDWIIDQQIKAMGQELYERNYAPSPIN